MTSRPARALLVTAVALAVTAGTAVAPAAAPARASAASAGPDLTALQWGPQRVGAVAARAGPAARLGSVTVAVLDSGVSVHPDLPTLDASDAARANFTTDPGTATDDASGHGTHVAGVIAAAVGGGGVDGVAPGVRILPVKVISDAGTGRASWVARGVDYAVAHGADVINLSVVSPESSTELDASLAAARSRGVVLVAAAGNEGAAGDPRMFPAASAGVIAVGATDRADRVAAFSETGPQVDLVAPGIDIASTAPGGQYRSMDGTSEAAPHVAAAAALVRAAVPGASPDLVERALASSATDLGAPGRDDASGHGLLDAARAVGAARVLAATAPAGSVATTTTATSRTGRAALRLALPVQVSAADGSTVSTGVVAVSGGGRALAVRPVRDGRVTLPLRALAPGTHALLLSYQPPTTGVGAVFAPSTTTVVLTATP